MSNITKKNLRLTCNKKTLICLRFFNISFKYIDKQNIKRILMLKILLKNQVIMMVISYIKNDGEGKTLKAIIIVE